MGDRGKKTYTTYDAKAKFNELLKRVRAGDKILISYHGRTVAEVRPIYGTGVDRALEQLAEQGIVDRPAAPTGRLEPIAKKPGALERFLESRE
jgi:prevent-host-death family protein